MNRLRLGAVLHFIIAIGHVACLFALDEAFEAYGICEIMHQMVSGHVWMLYALTIGLVLAFTLAGRRSLEPRRPRKMAVSDSDSNRVIIRPDRPISFGAVRINRVTQ